MLKPLLQILILQLSSLRTSSFQSFFKVHDSAPYRGLFQRNVYCYSLLHVKSEGLCRQFFSLCKRVLCSSYSRSNFFLTRSVCLIRLSRWLKAILDLIVSLKKDREFITRPLSDFHHLSLHNISLHTILVFTVTSSKIKMETLLLIQRV